MSHSASDGIGNRLYLLIPPRLLTLSLSLSLALSHSTPPLIHLPRSLLNISPRPIFLSSPSAAAFCLSPSRLLLPPFPRCKHPPPAAFTPSLRAPDGQTHSSARYRQNSDVPAETRESGNALPAVNTPLSQKVMQKIRNKNTGLQVSSLFGPHVGCKHC